MCLLLVSAIWKQQQTTVYFKLIFPRRSLCCDYSLFVRRFHMWCLFCHYLSLFLIFPSVGASEVVVVCVCVVGAGGGGGGGGGGETMLCFVIVAYSVHLLIYFYSSKTIHMNCQTLFCRKKNNVIY